ncbi:MAG: family 20 glycosylhydrolase [Bacteroidales bacterium]|nr:family 20 glycosylhydrolase [Bacteroidales bacterium]
MGKRILLSTLVLLAAACAKAPVAEWTEGEAGEDGRALNVLVLNNVPEGSRVWYQELFDRKEFVEGPEIVHYQGTSYYIDIPESGTVTIKYYGRPLPRHSWAPEGFVLQQKGKKDRPMEVKYNFLEHPKEDVQFEASYEVQPADIIPQVKRVCYGAEPASTTTEVKPAGWYMIKIGEDLEPVIEANDEEGKLYARVTLDKLPRPLQPMTIEDWPDYEYRGFMMDVARDFRSVEEICKLIDLMASWKMNVLHFHLGDDESWCLEIKPLPELTAFAGNHALPDWDLQETSALKPMANGHIGNMSYYTAEEYQQILKYAWERGIAVIPEFDAPGHSRASIKAMQARERNTGDDTYRLQDPADTSHYWTAQNFTDNVLSVYLPGVYKFYGVVFDEVIRLHREAGVPLPAIHIGGDEVPKGAWEGRDRVEMKEIFTLGMVQLAQERGIRIMGWEDMTLGLSEETLSKLLEVLYAVNVWHTDGVEGVPVILSPAAYTYMDLAYGLDAEDIGLTWAGTVDEKKSFSLNPLDFKGNVLGVQAQLWSENVRSLDDATYQLLPKALGVAERAWNSKADEDFNRFYSIIKAREIPAWELAGYNYKKR